MFSCSKTYRHLHASARCLLLLAYVLETCQVHDSAENDFLVPDQIQELFVDMDNHLEGFRPVTTIANITNCLLLVSAHLQDYYQMKKAFGEELSYPCINRLQKKELVSVFEEFYTDVVKAAGEGRLNLLQYLYYCEIY